MAKEIRKSIEFGGKTLTVSTGKLARQADSTVLVQYGETVVMATITSSNLREPLDYFPLTVDYQERLYAGGRIKGSRWVKREGRPTDDEILTSRLIDRSIRPLFPAEYSGREVQVIVTVLSVDLENSPDIPAAIAVSTALATSSIPWSGPVSVVRVGMSESGSLITNPTVEEIDKSRLDLIVSTTEQAVVMIEAGANEITEEEMLKGIEHAQSEGKTLIEFIESFAKEVGVQKEKVGKTATNSTLEKKIKEVTKDKIKDLITKSSKNEGGEGTNEIKRILFEEFSDEDRMVVSGIFEKLFKKEVRNMILAGKRPDGRKLDQVRELYAEVGLLPRTHGSGLFQRGQTQVMTIATLGASSLEQFIETAEGEETKRYIHHYSMPPYATGETGRIGSPSRREIGHGALAERALEPVIPAESEFPYTIRMVSEVLSSNGSTSMASVCGSTLALMDAGVPIKSPVAGIAMGLVVESDKSFVVLTDIAGIEDFNGDMDFKVAGTKDGITALQLDVKTLQLTLSTLKDALSQAKVARGEVMKAILKAISEPRKSLSKHAPKIKAVKIPQDKIGDLIGPSGKTIKKLIAETGAQIDVDDDGTVSVSGVTDEEVGEAIAKIESITHDLQVGEIYEGEVMRIQPFGAFVAVAPGKDGLVHISDMSDEYVKNPGDIVKIGQKVKVKVKKVDEFGRIDLTMRLNSDGRERDRRPQQQRRDGFDRKRSSSGPHFPASRLMQDGGSGYSRRNPSRNKRFSK